ncbi:MAG: hypothetical protein EZS28_053673, partial [Streblomastix strix]
MGQYTTGLLQTIQLELDWTQITILGQFMVTISILRTLLATEATGTKYVHSKVSETELGQQPCAGATAAAMRREEWKKKA